MRVYVTKYALTRGILVYEATEPAPGMCRVVHEQHGFQLPQYFHTPDWHKTPDAAIERARAMRDKQVKRLETTARNLRGLVFEIREEIPA